MATLSAEQRRREAKEAYGAYLAACPSHRLLDRLSDKWVGLLLAALRNGPRRYSELSAHIPGASQKMLTQTLRSLERDGLVTRTVTPAVPARVDYALTPLGASLRARLDLLNQWADEHMVEIDRARDSYDRALE